ncbi:hypothetical protein XELAEV_18029528mg [Xenopus laevis]|uniref:Uncharacterized protein n=1 Tax=Xenopus laevis TaxID=8355 RepID=A0A974CU12_XENLA|nr:hypothetical protein XELAEV_18029528mg [Xenopus laevis]
MGELANSSMSSLNGSLAGFYSGSSSSLSKSPPSPPSANISVPRCSAAIALASSIPAVSRKHRAGWPE